MGASQDTPKSTTLSSLQDQLFDYIVVGGGTSGCLLASRLAGAGHSVLLVEAGGEAEEQPHNLIPGLVVPKFANEEGNWLYETTAQKQLNDRTIVYPRGRGLGGSSANNFSSWVRGPACDWDDWADIVDDEWWKWENVVHYLKKLEAFNAECPKGMEKYFKPVPEMHCSDGPVGAGTGRVWQPLIEHCLKGAMQAGMELNTDHNDGDEMGVSVAQMNVDNGIRRSSAAAFLSSQARARLRNLTVVTHTLCKRIQFEDKRASGIELIPVKPASDEKPDTSVNLKVRKEIVLSAGTFETPHILLLSGIGPASELEKHSIPVIHDSPNVGRNIRDHSATSLEALIDPSISGHNQLLRDPEALAAAHKEYEASQTGPLAVFGASAVMAFPRIPELFTSAEFEALSPEVQAFLWKEGRPGTELWMHGGPLFYRGELKAEDSAIAIEGLCQNLLSKGSLTLRSSDPRELPIVDPAYCAEPYDWRIAIETVKTQLRIAKTPAMQAIIRKPLYGPGTRSADGTLTLASEDDESAIMKHLREELTQGFHSMGSCVMGSEENEDRVVDTEFKVLGIEGLRVADMSVCPILTNNHTQINAYLIAERCAQLILGDDGQGGFGRR